MGDGGVGWGGGGQDEKEGVIWEVGIIQIIKVMDEVRTQANYTNKKAKSAN